MGHHRHLHLSVPGRRTRRVGAARRMAFGNGHPAGAPARNHESLNRLCATEGPGGWARPAPSATVVRREEPPLDRRHRCRTRFSGPRAAPVQPDGASRRLRRNDGGGWVAVHVECGRRPSIIHIYASDADLCICAFRPPCVPLIQPTHSGGDGGGTGNLDREGSR